MIQYRLLYKALIYNCNDLEGELDHTDYLPVFSPTHNMKFSRDIPGLADTVCYLA